MKNKNIFISKKISSDIPILIVDLNDDKAYKKEKKEINNVINNIIRLQEKNGTKVFFTAEGSPHKDLNQLVYTNCKSWFPNSQAWMKNIASILNVEQIQICGIYRELCMVEVGRLLLNSGIVPIIIDNDDFSISAKCSAEEGDTLENRIKEVGMTFRYLL